jgi:HEAT repeat protein
MGIMANRGTAADSKWLFSIVRDRNQTVQTRRRALDLAARAANGGAEALALYDTIDDQTLKSALISLYARENDRAAIDKLISIAKSDENKSLRRRAISSLSRTQDPRARQALVEISTR